IQAIAALTFGTKTISKVDKIFGPGNQYVTAAKQFSQQYGVAIDMPAGPSEVLVIADKTAIPEFVSADLLSQAEHGADSQAILLSDNKEFISKTMKAVDDQLEALPRKDIAKKALDNSKAILLKNVNECIAFSNLYAPEHLILAVKNESKIANQIINAGSVFLGNYSCESAGDYASGTNHTLPTNGYARNYSGVSLDSFIKKITFQKLSAKGIKNLGPAIETMAEAEQLMAHKNAVTVRLKSINKTKKIKTSSSSSK
ncbi:MAG: histidinol dehydrogenase, partial [Ferruginibacter sp.]|nr:histidinol dehydrogenase [Ferruginibacter sp.]